MSKVSAYNLQPVLDWVNTCPFDYQISTLQGGYLHLKVQVPDERGLPDLRELDSATLTKVELDFFKKEGK